MSKVRKMNALEGARRRCREEFLPTLVGQEVLVKDLHDSGYAMLTVDETAVGYTGPLYRFRTKSGWAGRFQAHDVSWVEGDVIWLG